jgi:predicted PurR-regulated permease PerM
MTAAGDRKWLWLASLAFGGWLLYLLAPVLTPFLIGALLAYLGDPAARLLQRRRLSRTVAVCIVFLLMLLAGICLLLILIPALQQQLVSLVERVPQLLALVETRLLPWLTATLGVPLDAVPLDALRQTLQDNWRDIGSLLGMILGKVSDSGQALFAWFAYLVLVPVVTFYFMRDWDELVARCRRLLPRRTRAPSSDWSASATRCCPNSCAGS